MQYTLMSVVGLHMEAPEGDESGVYVGGGCKAVQQRLDG